MRAFVVILIMVVMVVRVVVLVRVHRELGGRDSGAQHTVRMEVHAGKRQAAEGVLQRVERQAGVE
jgi:preprotein translocase subunit SecG